jgi:hypothetical protein
MSPRDRPAAPSAACSWLLLALLSGFACSKGSEATKDGGIDCAGAARPCRSGEICVQHGQAAQLPSAACVTDPCAPQPLACGCAQQLCQGEESCVKTGERAITCQAGKCASPETPIATPQGERTIAAIAVGDLVFSRHRGQLQAVPVLEVHRTPVHDHQVLRLELASGAILQMSAGHPTADGRTLGDLRPGENLGGALIVSIRLVPYAAPYTYDILPDSDSGSYLAAGALVGSTLK